MKHLILALLLVATPALAQEDPFAKLESLLSSEEFKEAIVCDDLYQGTSQTASEARVEYCETVRYTASSTPRGGQDPVAQILSAINEVKVMVIEVEGRTTNLENKVNTISNTPQTVKTETIYVPTTPSVQPTYTPPVKERDYRKEKWWNGPSYDGSMKADGGHAQPITVGGEKTGVYRIAPSRETKGVKEWK